MCFVSSCIFVSYFFLFRASSALYFVLFSPSLFNFSCYSALTVKWTSHTNRIWRSQHNVVFVKNDHAFVIVLIKTDITHSPPPPHTLSLFSRKKVIWATVIKYIVYTEKNGTNIPDVLDTLSVLILFRWPLLSSFPS